VLLPPLPYKQAKKASLEQRKLKKRGRIYDRYLNQLLRYGGSEELKGDYIIVQFLTQQGRKEFDNTVKQYCTATGILYGQIPPARDAKGGLPMIELGELVTHAGYTEVTPNRFPHAVKESED
jgi:hypothetical protein